MKKSRYSEQQIVEILGEAEKGENTICEICKAYGISEQSFYRWRKKFGGMETGDVRKLKNLEKENAQLKRILAERDLEIDAIKAVLSKKF